MDSFTAYLNAVVDAGYYRRHPILEPRADAYTGQWPEPELHYDLQLRDDDGLWHPLIKTDELTKPEAILG